jgi:DNA-binding transcriptional MerR regulator
VEKSEITYSVKQVAEQIGVKPVTFRAWCNALEQAGYKIMRDEQGNRLYTERDIFTLRQLSEYMNKNIEWDQAIKLIIDEFTEELLPLANPQEPHNTESNEMVRTIQELNETLQQMREAVQRQHDVNQAIIKRLDERDRFIEDLDRTIQEMNKTSQQMREAMQQQREFNQELIKIVDETDRYIEDSVKHRDEHMMTALRQIEENTRLEIAAAREQQEEKQPWWKLLLRK